MSFPRRVGITNWFRIAAALIAAAAAGMLVSRTALRGPSARETAHQRAATPSGMAFVPAGPSWRGTDDRDADENARPSGRLSLCSFYMGRTVVTNRTVARF